MKNRKLDREISVTFAFLVCLICGALWGIFFVSGSLWGIPSLLVALYVVYREGFSYPGPYYGPG